MVSKIKGKTREEIIKIFPKWKNCGFKKGEKRPEQSFRMKGNKLAIGHKPWNKDLPKGETFKHYKEGHPKLNLGKRNLWLSEYNKNNSARLKKPKSEETKQKFRIAAQKRIMRMFGGPNIGRNEKQILDKLEEQYNYKILRQYSVDGYFVDGYIPEKNLIIEVDEKPKVKERDLERENYIKEKLNCEVVRIKDY